MHRREGDGMASSEASSTNSNGVDERLRQLEARLARIEARLGLAPPLVVDAPLRASPHETLPTMPTRHGRRPHDSSIGAPEQTRAQGERLDERGWPVAPPTV